MTTEEGSGRGAVGMTSTEAAVAQALAGAGGLDASDVIGLSVRRACAAGFGERLPKKGGTATK